MQAKLTVLVMACTQGYRDMADLFLRHPKIAVNQQIAVNIISITFFFITDFPCVLLFSISFPLFRMGTLHSTGRVPTVLLLWC
jgi:hypothetical protein